MFKKTGKNLAKQQVKKFLEKRSIDSTAWGIIYKISQPSLEQSENKKGKK